VAVSGHRDDSGCPAPQVRLGSWIVRPTRTMKISRARFAVIFLALAFTIAAGFLGYELWQNLMWKMQVETCEARFVGRQASVVCDCRRAER
jgi:hypothetical protein